MPKEFKLILAGPLKKENSLYFQNLIKKINKFELNDRIEIKTEFLDNFDEYIKCSDIFLFPSKAEGLGTPAESQACGVPVGIISTALPILLLREMRVVIF